ncbi:MAG: hypothetical protein D6784_05365 [Chloroflexi bacterium]|nr:MAG: hypothetical protein D6784_05365 [Chloroflexota bacterium]
MESLRQKYTRWQFLFFPPAFEPLRPVPLTTYLLIVAVSAGLFAVIGLFVPADGFLGYDWYHYYSRGIREPFYPPWLVYVQWLTWPGLVGLNCAGLVMALYQRRASPVRMALPFLSLPALWLLFLGQLDGLVLLGLTGLPWLIPLASLKPQLSFFAFLTHPRRLVWLGVWVGLSIAVWGFWLTDMFSYDRQWQALYTGATQPQNISLWPWGVPLALVLLWHSRGDVDMLMLAGSFVTPHLMPYNYVVVLPALARIPFWLACLLVAISWLPLSANWVGDWGWQLGHLFAGTLWLALYTKRRRGAVCLP